MALEWLRRRDSALDAQLRKFLYSSVPVTEVGEGDSGESTAAVDSGSLGIGSLKGAER